MRMSLALGTLLQQGNFHTLLQQVQIGHLSYASGTSTVQAKSWHFTEVVAA